MNQSEKEKEFSEMFQEQEGRKGLLETRKEFEEGGAIQVLGVGSNQVEQV